MPLSDYDRWLLTQQQTAAIRARGTPNAPAAQDQYLQYADQLGQQQHNFDTTGQYNQPDERRHEFDANLALKQQQDQNNQLFQQQVEAHRNQLARYGIMQQGDDTQAKIAGQLADTNLRGQYGVINDQFGLAREQMQQEGQNQRTDQEVQGRYGVQWQQQAAKQMQADWQNVQKVLPSLDPSEREDLIGQFHKRWESANVPMPVEVPQEDIPDWQNPDKQLESARQMDPTVPWQINSKGELQAPRGWSWRNSKEGVEAQHTHELQKAEIANQNKAAEADVKKQESFDMVQLKAQDAEMKAAQAEDKHSQDMRHAEDLHYQKMQADVAAMEMKVAKEKAIAKERDQPAVDTSGVEKIIADRKNELAQYNARRKSLDANDAFAGMDSAPQSPAASPSGPPAWYVALPHGAKYTAPDGSKRVKP